METGDNRHLYSQILEFRPRKADLRRMAILDAVIDCIAEMGILAMTAQGVGRIAKMRRSHVTYYFPNQDTMVEAAIKFVVSTGQEITIAHIAAEKAPEAQLKAMVRATFAWFERYPKHAAVMLLLHYYGTCDKRYRKLNTQIRTAGENRLEAILRGRPAKKGKGLPSSRDLSVALRAFLAGSLNNIFSGEVSVNYDKEREATEKAMSAMALTYWK